jgi:hypothetical protein
LSFLLARTLERLHFASLGFHELFCLLLHRRCTSQIL